MVPDFSRQHPLHPHKMDYAPKNSQISEKFFSDEKWYQVPFFSAVKPLSGKKKNWYLVPFFLVLIFLISPLPSFGKTSLPVKFFFCRNPLRGIWLPQAGRSAPNFSRFFSRLFQVEFAYTGRGRLFSANQSIELLRENPQWEMQKEVR